MENVFPYSTPHTYKNPTILYMTQNGVLQLPADVQPNKSALEQPFMAIELLDGDFQQDSAPACHFC